MKIAKPILLVSTPIGVIGGLNEAWRLAGGLVVIMAMMVILMAVAVIGVVRVARSEQRAVRAARSPSHAGS
jgi:hypothetical protein